MLHVRFKSVKRLITTPFFEEFLHIWKALEKIILKKNFEGLFFKDKIIVLHF